MFYVLMYLSAIVLANLAVAIWGPSVAVLTGFLFIALDLTARDRLHEAWQGNRLVAKMVLLIATGSVLTYMLNRNAGPIAVASFVAFACAALVDTGCLSPAAFQTRVAENKWLECAEAQQWTR